MNNTKAIFGIICFINFIICIITIVWSIWDLNIIIVKIMATSLLLTLISGVIFVSYDENDL